MGLLARIRSGNLVRDGSRCHARTRRGGERETSLPFLLGSLRWRPRDAVAVVVAAVAVIAILVNILFMQPGLPPTPLFKPVEVQNAAEPAQTAPNREAASAPFTPKLVAPHAPRTPGEIIMDIQRELARHGYYEGPVDGLYGPRTDSAIREFERASGVKLAAQPSELLLQVIKGAPLRSGNRVAESIAASGASTLRAIQPPAAESGRIIAVQRGLSEFGYAQIKPTGTLDPDTQRAIISFERQRNLPITGQLSQRFIRELSTVTGRRLE